MALTQIKTTGIADNAITDAKVANDITIDTASAVPASGITGDTLASGVTASSLTSVGSLTGLTIAGTGVNASPNLAIDNSSSSSYIHSIEALGANMTSGQTNIINLGKIGDAKNSGVIGYKWNGAGSNDNLLTFEHWGTGALMTMNGLGVVGMGSYTPGKVNGTDRTGGGDSGILHLQGTVPRIIFDDNSDTPQFALTAQDFFAVDKIPDNNSSESQLLKIESTGTTVINSTGANSLNLFRSDSGNVMQIGCTTVSDDASMYLRTNGVFNFHTPGSGQIRFSSGGSQALNLDASQNASFSGDVTISKSNAKMTIFASNTGDHESLVFDRNTASNGDSQEIRWKLQGNSYPGGYILHEYDDANNSSLAFGVRDNGTPGTALSISSSKNATFASLVKAPLFRTDTQATSVADSTWTDLNGLTNLSAGLYIIHAYKDNYAGNDWSARGIVEATGHSTIDGDFENQSGFQLRVNGNDVQLYHTLGQTFGITVSWLKIG